MSAYHSASQQRYFNARAKWYRPAWTATTYKKNYETKLRPGGYSALVWRKRGPSISTLFKAL